MKRTCLWLKGLHKLQGLEEVAANPKKYKPLTRSKTFPGIAKAMADQWG